MNKKNKLILQMIRTVGDIADLFDRMDRNIQHNKNKEPRMNKKLKNGEEAKIKELHKSGNYTQAQIAMLFKISQQRVSAICAGEKK